VGISDGYKRREIRKTRTISEVEAIWFKLHCVEQELWNGVIRLIIRKIYDAGGVAHCIPSNSNKNDNKWWAWKVENNGKDFGKEEVITYSFNWVDKPKRACNLDLGQLFYDMEKRHERCELKWQWIARGILKTMLEDYMYKNYKLPIVIDDSYIKDLVINGRHYVFVGEYNHHGYPTWVNKTWATKLEEIHL